MGGDTFVALPPVPVTLVIGGERLDLTPLKVGEHRGPYERSVHSS